MSRNEHDRATSHKDTTKAVFVTSDGEDLETVLRDLWERISILDNEPIRTFTVDAVIA